MSPLLAAGRRRLLTDLPLDLLIWPAIALLAVLMSRLTTIDLDVSRLFFDASLGEFPRRHDWLWSTVLHDGIKQVSTLLWVTLLALAIRAWRAGRTDAATALTFCLVAAFIAITVNSKLKHMSAHSCPWSLTTFGGTADYFRLLATVPDHAGPGRCLPSGHASTGFMWLPAIYACTRWHPQWTWPVAGLVVAFGALCGLTQIVRGAHLLSHVLMTAAVCGGIGGLLHHLLLRCSRRTVVLLPATP